MSPWPLIPLGEVLTKSADSISIDPEQRYQEVTVRLWGKGVVQRREVQGVEIAATTRTAVRANQFIISRIDARNGASGLVPNELDGAIVSNDFPVYIPCQGRMIPEYLGWFSKTKSFVELCKSASEGTTNRVRLKEDRFLATPIPLPQVEEQQKLVTKLDAASKMISEALRLSLRADEERLALSAAVIDTRLKDAASKYGISRLSEACRLITDGDHFTPRFSDKGVKFIFVGNVSQGHLHFNGCKFVEPAYYEAIKDIRKPQRGDILYSAVGATLGVPALVDTDEDFCFQRHLALIRPDPSKAVARYLWYSLKSQTVFDQAWRATTGSAQPTVPLKSIRCLPIPLPPLHEQLTVIRILDEIEEQMNFLAQRQSERSREINALLPAILNQAFQGELS